MVGTKHGLIIIYRMMSEEQRRKLLAFIRSLLKKGCLNNLFRQKQKDHRAVIGGLFA